MVESPPTQAVAPVATVLQLAPPTTPLDPDAQLRVWNDHTLPFLRTLTGGEPEEEAVTWQVIDDAKLGACPASWFHATLETALDRLHRAQQAGGGVFVTVNATDGKGRRGVNVKTARAVWVDLDKGSFPALPLPPSMVVRTKAGWHVYWLLETGTPAGV